MTQRYTHTDLDNDTLTASDWDGDVVVDVSGRSVVLSPADAARLAAWLLNRRRFVPPTLTNSL